ncbi:hypothetical protein O3G_MSEX011352 [Manduca sexta]|uniref:Chorein N-terminal domain-containing protein n=1 Tax=Manduca sexta TaxID=7130 RepID=A0A922CVG7_MANSE|nr:hypothetical protein O3G_MSEX011352 [Manduca sexta]
MFKIESYVTPILLSYVDKYVKDFKPADAQVSLWGGGVALHNLVLKADVLQQEVALPFTLVSGRIHELLIQVPWTKIMSEPIIVTIDTIECVLSLNPPTPTEETPPPESPSRKTQMVEAPPGYMQALVRRIVSNIALRVHHLIVKYVQDDIVMSFNVKHVAVDSAGSNWEPAFADIDQNLPVIRRLVRLDDLTLCLDRTDSDGKIRFYQEPLLYKCQLYLRVLTRLVAANTRRASSLSVQLRSTKLAWSVTSDQLTLLLRLMRERTAVYKPPPPVPKQPSVSQVPLHVTSSNSAEPARSESWSEWAWSWLPTWMDREGGVEEAPMPASPTPVHFTAYLDDVSLVLKLMELDGGSRKRSRGVLELSATHAAMKSYICSPTTLRVRIATRALTVLSHGKCACGHLDYEAANDEPTVYLKRFSVEEEEPWKWPEEEFVDDVVETAEVAQEGARDTPDTDPDSDTQNTEHSDHGLPEEPSPEPKEAHEDVDELWQQMAPVVYLEYTHERSPPQIYINPYDNPPLDFEHSDWAEECNLKVQIEPMEIRLCPGLMHRIAALRSICADLPPVPDIELPMKVLTVEECEALCDNLPQRRITIEAKALYIRMLPWDHSSSEKALPPPLVFHIHLPKATVMINGPLYPHRVCSAACQMPDDAGPLWQGARVHVTVALSRMQAGVCAPTDTQPLPCARTDLRLVMHILLHKEYFTRRESVFFSYSFKIREANVCGSAARLMAAWQIPTSLFRERVSSPLRQTTLTRDALNDEAVAVDLTVEEFGVRGYITKNMNTHIVTMHSARATAFHERKGGELKQAWLFCAPDTPTTSPYLRMAVQWCTNPVPNGLDYVGVWMEPTAICVDPLFIAWLAYKPQLKSFMSESHSLVLTRSASSTQYFLRRRATPPSSSGRGVSRSGSGADMVHLRPRSVGSSSEPSEKKEKRPPQATKPPENWWSDEKLLAVHARLQSMLVNVELGLVLVYVTMSTASAIDCATIRDAMERHADASQDVLVLSLGRLLMHSTSVTKHLWHEIRHDGPTFTSGSPEHMSQEPESFPWKIRLADVSCYTLEMRTGSRFTKERSSTMLRSQLKIPCLAAPRTVLELVTTSITLSVVTKSLQVKTFMKKDAKKQTAANVDESRMKYFTTGMDFKPATLKEFVRGPARRKKTAEQTEPKVEPPPPTTTTKGPVVSLGVHLHADTPPIIVRLEQDQVHVVAATLHCFKHILTLLQRSPLSVQRHGYTSAGSSHRSLIRSVSEIEELQSPSEDTMSENQSELISIFEAQSAMESSMKLKTFFWFQWVVSRATLVVATQHAKLAFDIDDIISTMDLQMHYNQLRIKLASASVRHYERVGSDEWAAGVLGGRVLEAREPTNAKEENHFLAVTITQAQISNLPPSWKEELHPKLLEHKSSMDSMWEVYATLAPLEAVLRPIVVEHIVLLVQEMAPRSFCPLQGEDEPRASTWQWPFCYVTAGGLRLLVTCEEENMDNDDTFMFVIGRISVNPHPENPICRRGVNTATESGWMTSGGSFDGRQYEVLVNNVAIRSTRFSQIVNQEESEAEMLKGTGGENPALKWSQPVVSPAVTPVLHSMDIGCVLAPALYVGGVLACGPALELNLMSDCAIELSVEQLDLVRRVTQDMYNAVREGHESGILFDEEKHGVCPYATLLMSRESEETSLTFSETTVVDDTAKDTTKSPSETRRVMAADSGVDTTSHSTFKSGRNFDENQLNVKKSVSVAFVEQMAEASEYLEVYVTMGTVEVSLYTEDDGSTDIISLRPPVIDRPKTPEPLVQVVIEETREPAKKDELESPGGSRSITETVRKVEMGKVKLELTNVMPHARKSAGNLPLLHVTLQQPNFYYWKRKSLKTIQMSLFNAWVGLGMGQVEGQWNEVLFSTAKGVSDPVTDIRPALATMKIVAPIGVAAYMSSTSSKAEKGTVKLDVERPILIDVCTDRLKRLKGIYRLVEKKVLNKLEPSESISHDIPALYKLKKLLVAQNLESITVQTSQIAVCGIEGTVGWDAATLQVASGLRPERLVARASLTSLLVCAGPAGDRRHVLLQPLMMGAELEATWEAWRRAEGGLSACEPTVRVGLEYDCVIFDLRPSDLSALIRMRQAYEEIFKEDSQRPPAPSTSSETIYKGRPRATSSSVSERRASGSEDTASWEVGDHYYKDDLRSGAFKIISGGQLPMAYQVTLYGSCVSWRYPHPRAITRVIVFPLPGQNKETDCVLEFFSPMLSRWESHTYFKLPVGEPRELQLQILPPEAVFAQIWRFRACYDNDLKNPPYEFQISKFMPRTDPLSPDAAPDPPSGRRGDCGVTAEQLSGVLRVDSYFAPRLLPRTRLVVRVAFLEVHAHNSLPCLSSQATTLEGYYVSRPLMRSHRVLTLLARDTTAHALLGSPAGTLLLLDTEISSDILESTSGAMERLVEEFSAQIGLTIPCGSLNNVRARVCAGDVRVSLLVPRLRTLHALAGDWMPAVEQYLQDSPLYTSKELFSDKIMSKRELAAAAEVALEGRVFLWIHNSCASALRIGQEGTDEVVPLGPGARLAYRWRNPTAAKKIRFAFAGPTTDWHWSNSIPFTAGGARVRLEDAESLGGSKLTPGAGVFLHAKVEETGARRCLHLAGRLALANMLRFDLLYKVRARCTDSNQWRTVCSGELGSETVGRTVLCGAVCEMVLKIKLMSHDTGWSGDIPLKECPKENVPWLVKVPSEGDVPYMSVWCRVVRARSDGRILAMVWPLYVLHSHLPLDTDVLISTETGLSSTELGPDQSRPPPLIQTTPGRGTSTHLLAPGTTAARHNLSFQYRNIECPVTREVVPLHYGVTDTSVFDKRAPVNSVDEVIEDILRWLKRSSRSAVSSWPYSVVAKHWSGTWQPALLQPRCEVTVCLIPIFLFGSSIL